MLNSATRALLASAFLTLAVPQAVAQPADCASTAAKCTAACAMRITGGLFAVRQCKAGCDAEQQACSQRGRPAATAPAATATPDPQEARASLVGLQIGTRSLSVGPLTTVEGLRPYDVPLLDGIPLLDLTHGQSDPSRIEVLRSFAQAYARSRLDWTNVLGANYTPDNGGSGVGLMRQWLRTSQLVMEGKSLEADIRSGLSGTAWSSLEPETLRTYIPCAGLTFDNSSPCSRPEATRGMAQYRGDNEFERDRSRTAFVTEVSSRLQKAFATRTLRFYVLEQREVRDYDFQREVFAIRAVMTNGSPMSAPVRAEMPTTVGVFGTLVTLDRLLPDELRLPKAEAENWLRKVIEHQVPGSRGRRVYALTRLDCNTGVVSSYSAAKCTVVSATLFADTALQVKLSDL